jgi:hypothetical protein
MTAHIGAAHPCPQEDPATEQRKPFLCRFGTASARGRSPSLTGQEHNPIGADCPGGRPPCDTVSIITAWSELWAETIAVTIVRSRVLVSTINCRMCALSNGAVP